MLSSTSELLTMLNRHKSVIEELFEKRDQDIYFHDISSADFAENIPSFARMGILESEEEPFLLNDILVSFLENMLETNRRIEISAIHEALEYLKDKISDYRNKDLAHKQQVSLREIKKTLLRINKIIMREFKVISERVALEYTTQVNYAEKIIELNRYRKNIEALILAEKEVDAVIEKEVEFFKNSHHHEVLDAFYLLNNTLRGLRVSLVELQQTVVEYINKSDEKRSFFEKVLKLREMIKNQEIKQKTNIEAVVNEDNNQKLFILNVKKFKTQLSLDTLNYYSDVFRGRVKKVQLEGVVREKVVQFAPKLDKEAFNAPLIIYSDEIDKYTLQRAFRGTRLDLFTFLDHKRYPEEMTLDDKLLLYSQMITLFEQEYDYTEKYKRYGHYHVLDIYNKKRG